MPSKTVRHIIQAALLAALYAALTMLPAPLSYGPIQIRFSEALTVLPYFTPVAIPGLFVGCLGANLLGAGIWDIVLGSLATLLAAYFSRKMPKKWLVPLPPVVINVIIVGPMLAALYGQPLWLAMGGVLMGQLVACYGLGYPLLLILEKADIQWL